MIPTAPIPKPEPVKKPRSLSDIDADLARVTKLLLREDDRYQRVEYKNQIDKYLDERLAITNIK